MDRQKKRDFNQMNCGTEAFKNAQRDNARADFVKSLLYYDEWTLIVIYTFFYLYLILIKFVNPKLYIIVQSFALIHPPIYVPPAIAPVVIALAAMGAPPMARDWAPAAREPADTAPAA